MASEASRGTPPSSRTATHPNNSFSSTHTQHVSTCHRLQNLHATLLSPPALLRSQLPRAEVVWPTAVLHAPQRLSAPSEGNPESTRPSTLLWPRQPAPPCRPLVAPRPLHLWPRSGCCSETLAPRDTSSASPSEEQPPSHQPWAHGASAAASLNATAPPALPGVQKPSGNACCMKQLINGNFAASSRIKRRLID